MGFTLIGTRTKAATGVGTSAYTTDALDTTGTRILVVAMSWYTAGSATFTIADSRGNTWTALAVVSIGTTRQQCWYCIEPSVGSTHTVTLTASTSATYGIASLVAYGGAGATYQGRVTGTGSGLTSFAVGSITPGSAGSLAVSSLHLTAGAGASATNGSGLTSFGVDYSAAVCVGSTTAHGVVGTSPLNVTHSWTGSSTVAGQTLIFNPDSTSILPLVLHHRRMQGAY